MRRNLLAGLASEFDLIKRDEQALHRPQNEAENIVVVYPEFGMNPQPTTTKPGHTVDEAPITDDEIPDICYGQPVICTYGAPIDT